MASEIITIHDDSNTKDLYPKTVAEAVYYNGKNNLAEVLSGVGRFYGIDTSNVIATWSGNATNTYTAEQDCWGMAHLLNYGSNYAYINDVLVYNATSSSDNSTKRPYIFPLKKGDVFKVTPHPGHPCGYTIYGIK